MLTTLTKHMLLAFSLKGKLFPGDVVVSVSTLHTWARLLASHLSVRTGEPLVNVSVDRQAPGLLTSKDTKAEVPLAGASWKEMSAHILFLGPE